MYAAVISPPVGRLGLSVAEDAFVTGLEFLDDNTPLIVPKTAFTKQVAKSLEAYFECNKPLSNLPIRMKGTHFQLKVWEYLKSIPTGNTLTYGMIAKFLRTSPRAVGNACRQNPLPIIVPCHRVIASDGSVGGYGGERKGRFFRIKKWLLDHEGLPQIRQL